MASDVNDLKLAFGAQKALLQALSQTQSEHTATLANHTATLAEHTATLADHTARLTRLEAGMTEVRAGVHTIIGLLDRELGD
jgi:multidrug resistance efflux pump